MYCAHPSKPSAWGNDAFGSNAIVVWDIKEIKSNNAYIYAVTNSNTITLVKRLEKNVAFTPATIDGLPVTAIGPNSIDLTGESTSLFVISDGVKTIYDYAFGYCDKIIIPDSVENIGSLYLYANYVFFEGTAETWETFDVEFGGGYVYFYSETEPTDDGNYWHYDTDGVTPITMWN